MILTLNAGSPSLTFALFATLAADATQPAPVRGEIEDLDGTPHFFARDASGAVLAEHRSPAGGAAPFGAALEALLSFAGEHLGGAGLVAVGHRVVHGGGDHIAPERITPALLTALEALTPLDPLDTPANLAPIRAVVAARPGLPQVVCFDTAFHHTLLLVARTFALPRAITDAGAPLWLPRPVLRIHRLVPAGRLAASGRRPVDRGPSRRWRQPSRCWPAGALIRRPASPRSMD